MRRRVLLTCEDYLPSIGGAEICVHNLRQEFIKSGYHITVFTNTIETTDDEEGVVRLRWSFRPRSLAEHLKVLWQLIGKHDLVHCQYSFRLACLCAVIARLRRKPMLLTQFLFLCHILLLHRCNQFHSVLQSELLCAAALL